MLKILKLAQKFFCFFAFLRAKRKYIPISPPRKNITSKCSISLSDDVTIVLVGNNAHVCGLPDWELTTHDKDKRTNIVLENCEVTLKYLKQAFPVRFHAKKKNSRML